MESTKKRINTKFLTRVAIFGAISSILYVAPWLTFKLPFFPPFLSFHFDEIPAFIAGFAFGPLEAFMILLVKTIIKIPSSETLVIGEIADLIYSSAFILPAAFIYKNKRTFKDATIGIGYGLVSQLLVSSICNALFMIDLYAFVFNLSSNQILAMCQEVNPKITDLKFTIIIYGILPFNLLKNVMVIIPVIALYKRLSPVFKKLR